MRGSSPSPSFLPLPVVLSAHLILKCKRVNYVIFPRRPCLFANSITNMAGASFGLSSDASSPSLSPCYSPQLPVCFEKSSRFTIKKQRESKKKGSPNRGTPLCVFHVLLFDCRTLRRLPGAKQREEKDEAALGIYGSVLVLKILANVH